MNNKSDSNKQPRWIRPLPERVVNKIAAGEVIERPAAVLKELAENSIDAGSDRIEIQIEKSGTKLIKIVDNGCGITEEQIEIAFSRHATSKISVFKDLDSLGTYGFRGEALPSVASVSRMRMVSRSLEASSGTEIIYEGGVMQSLKPVASAPGTTVEVENLFFNTPARRKFLKSETTEARYVSRTAMALAIGRQDIAFSLKMNGRKIFSLPKQQNLVERVADVLGKNRQFLAVDGNDEYASVHGCIGLPDIAQHNRYGQFIFVNGRYIQSPTLSHAFVSGYGELIPRGLFPVGALLITVDPSEIDVNVHPGKIEVRLAREREIHHLIHHLIADALRQDGIIPSFDISHRKSSSSAPSFSGGISMPQSSSQAVVPGIYGGNKVDSNSLSELYRPPNTAHTSEDNTSIKVNRETGEVLDNSQSVAESPAHTVDDNSDVGPSAGFRYIGRFADLYLLLQTGEDLYIVDQHTAHERVLYEEILARIEQKTADGQSLLFPVQVELTAEQLAVFEESQEMLNRSGFTVSSFGGRMINIEAVPIVLSTKSPEKVILKIIDDISSQRKVGQDLTKTMAQSIACRSAVMSGNRLNEQEAEHLLNVLLKCREPYSCPHGRPTFIKISKSDLNRQFGRE